MNPKLLSKGSIGGLAVKLARECYFGQELMSKCTVFGFKNLPALPKDRLSQLKQKLSSLHPDLITSPVEFEGYWKKAIDSMNHAMAKQRSMCTAIIDLSN